MNFNDALGILGFTSDDEVNKATIKKAYRRACQKYHPDKGGSVHMMQAVNQANDLLKSFNPDEHTINYEYVDVDYPDSLNDAINAVLGFAGVVIEVCGNWVWLTGNTKPFSKEIGKQGAGYFWAKKKQAWYFRPSKWKSSSRGNYSLNDIRDIHGSFHVKGSKNKKLGVAGG